MVAFFNPNKLAREKKPILILLFKIGLFVELWKRSGKRLHAEPAGLVRHRRFYTKKGHIVNVCIKTKRLTDLACISYGAQSSAFSAAEEEQRRPSRSTVGVGFR